MSAGMFLCGATRFKLTFSSKGNLNCFWNYAKELEGKWVALVPAEDDVHIAMATERDRLKAANAELAAALLLIDPSGKFHAWQNGNGEGIGHRLAAALTKHQGATA